MKNQLFYCKEGCYTVKNKWKVVFEKTLEVLLEYVVINLMSSVNMILEKFNSLCFNMSRSVISTIIQNYVEPKQNILMKKTDTFTKTYLSRLFNSNLGRYNEIDEELNISLTYQNIPCVKHKLEEKET